LVTVGSSSVLPARHNKGSDLSRGGPLYHAPARVFERTVESGRHRYCPVGGTHKAGKL
jgi:hypothetical protein